MEQFDKLSNSVQRRVMDNGLTIVTREDHSVPIVTSMVWYRVGSRLEEPGVRGISHFLEHMMFKGSARYGKGEIDAVTLRNGGFNNAFTSNDYTAYYFSFASDRWWPALEMEADRMAHNLFNFHEFQLEKEVVIEELKMELDSPWGSLRQAVARESFQAHPYRFPVIGLYQDLLSLTLDQMVEHYRKFYVPANATLVLVGDFQTGQAIGRIEELFGDLPSGEPTPAGINGEEKRAGRTRIRRPGEVRRMLMAFPAPSVKQADHYAIHLLDKVLSEGKLSRLYRRLVESEKVVSMVGTDFAETLDPYLFFIRSELVSDADCARVESLVLEEVARLAREPLSESELKRAKNQCIMGFLSDFETTLDQALQLGLMETLDRFEYWDDYIERIRSLSAPEVLEVARKFLLPARATVGWWG
ncbi:MAG: M16 family metallopeptidase [Acidobacteriota bacterium]